ncbi:hypothetical protein ACS0TY_029795 [Phlomoides rotata]
MEVDRVGTSKFCFVPSLSLEELKEKTDIFGSKALIGEGSYGRVSFAQLNDGKEVAIKKLDVASEPDSNVEFLTHVSMVSRLKHDNLVELLGYCVDDNLRVFAYEFATMGSLHDILHGMFHSLRYGRCPLAAAVTRTPEITNKY